MKRERVSIVIVTAQTRRRGRPPAPSTEKGSVVSTWLLESEHDQLAREALKDRTTISKLIRRRLFGRRP